MKRVYFESHDLRKNIIRLNHTTLTRKPAGYLTGFNWHKNIEIIYFWGGEGQVLCDTASYEVKAGDIFIFNSNALHGFKTDDVLQYDWLIVDSDFLAHNGIDVTNLYFEQHIHSEQLNSLFVELVKEAESEDDYRDIALRARVLAVFAHLLRHHLGVRPKISHGGDTTGSIKLALEFINREYGRKLTLEEIANAAGLSKYHFSREFKKVTHTTVTSYLNMTRCKHAKLLLLSNTYSVHDAATACGFENASFFSKTFRNTMGYLPSEIKGKSE